MLTRRDFGKLGVAAAALASSSSLPGQSQSSSLPLESQDPRRVGYRPNGAYWGHGSEKIDLLSGNLCFSRRLLSLQSRGLGVAVNASYNSQHSKHDNSETKWYGFDVGFGYGWRIQIACIVPKIVSGSITGYTYIDGHGSEYILTFSGDNWISLSGQYATWYPTTNTLKFASGKTMSFGCISSSGEPDAGSMYPTLIQCSNGNQIVVQYLAGYRAGELNSSCRISKISDARSAYSSDGSQSFLFAYSAARLPHLLSITSGLSTSETYSFSYSQQSLSSPYADSEAESKTIQTLNSIAGISGHVESFVYNSYAELTSAGLKHGGKLGWEYSTVGFSNGTAIREIAARTAKASESSDLQSHTLLRDPSDGQGVVHSTAILTEHNKTSRRVWTFNSDKGSPDCGLAASSISYSGDRPLHRAMMSWSRTASGAPYLSLHTKILDPGTADQQTSRSASTRDQFGNLLTHSLFEYDNPDTPSRTVTYSYLGESSYISKHILNRSLSKKVTDRHDSVEFVENKYDTTPLGECDGVTHHDGVAFSAANIIRGNLTQRTVGGVSSSLHYDRTGTLRSVEDGSGSKTSFTPAAGTNNTRHGVMVPNENMDLATTINYASGLPTAVNKPNGVQVSTAYDSLGRVTSQTSPSGAVSNVSYGLGPTSVTKSLNGRWSKKTFDGFGRVVQEEHGDSTGTSKVTKLEYAPVPHTTLGKAARVSLPHAPGEDPVWTHRSYDDLGRLVSHKSRSAGTKTIEYAGNSSILKDAEGRKKKLIYNAQGKLVKVVLPSPDGAADQETQYLYNTLGKLTGVVMPRSQGVQKRRFQYDSGGRPTLRHHAESGPQKLNYNPDGTLASKVDAKGQMEVFSRDALKRVISITRYNEKKIVQPNETYTYHYDTNPFESGFSENAIGRLAAVQWGSTNTLPGLMTEMYSYTVSGRLARRRLRLNRGKNNVDLDATCSYDNEGRLMTVIYPAGGPSLQHTYDSLGHLIGISDSSNPVVKDVAYDAVGKLTGLKLLASASGDYMAEHRQYDEQDRLSHLVTGPAGSSENNAHIPKVNLQYDYWKDGRLHVETDVMEGVSTTYDYDIQGRLATAKSSDGNWGFAFKYDGFGNRVSQSVIEGQAFEHNVNHDPATNWMLSDNTSYDANGNITSLPYLRMDYDVLNRVKHLFSSAVGEEIYAYNHQNKRVWVRTAKSGEQLYFYMGSRLLAVYDLDTDAIGNITASFKSANIFFGNRIVKSSGGTVVIDRLGATRAWSSKDGVKVTKYLPFGEELKKTSDDVAKFGGYQRDASGLDYAKNRYYSSSIGRFITPDPYEKSARSTNPNSWNRYAFVKNDPINRVDPNGLNDTGTGDGSTYQDPETFQNGSVLSQTSSYNSSGSLEVITVILLTGGSTEDSVSIDVPSMADQLAALSGAIGASAGFLGSVAALYNEAGSGISAADATMITGEAEGVGAIATGLEGMELALALTAGATGVGLLLALAVVGYMYYEYEQSHP